MHILAKVKDGIVEDVIVSPEIPAASDGYVFIEVQGGPELLGKTASEVSGGQSLSIVIEEPVAEVVAEEVVAVVEEVAVEEVAEESAPEVAPE
jgi:hypothetical protein